MSWLQVSQYVFPCAHLITCWNQHLQGKTVRIWIDVCQHSCAAELRTTKLALRHLSPIIKSYSSFSFSWVRTVRVFSGSNLLQAADCMTGGVQRLWSWLRLRRPTLSVVDCPWRPSESLWKLRLCKNRAHLKGQLGYKDVKGVTSRSDQSPTVLCKQVPELLEEMCIWMLSVYGQICFPTHFAHVWKESQKW